MNEISTVILNLNTNLKMESYYSNWFEFPITWLVTHHILAVPQGIYIRICTDIKKKKKKGESYLRPNWLRF